MSLWRFIENKLAEMGKDEKWLVDECGFTGYMLPRIRAGGVIQNATKQKLAHAFKCSIGDINAAIAQIDPPEQNTELPAAAKEVIDAYMDDGPAKIPADKIKWHPDQDAIDTPAHRSATEIAAREIGAYRDKLLGICLQLLSDAAEANVKDADEIYKAMGRTLLRELMK